MRCPRWARQIGLALVLAATSQAAIYATEQEPPGESFGQRADRGQNRWPRGEFGGFGGFGGGGFGGPRNQPQPIPDHPIETGYVFLDGVYLAPPYRIRLVENGVSINGRVLPCRPPEPEFGGRGRFEGPTADPWRRLAAQVASQLSAQGVVMAFPNQPLVALDGGAGAYDLFQRLTGEGKNPARVELVDRLPPGFDERIWNKWVASFSPSIGLRARAVSLITSFDANDAEAHASVAASRRLDALAYPLTLGGMILTVLSMGHLLGGRPAAGKTALEQDASPDTLKALQYSLVLIGLLSLLDLAWTIMASQAGQMRELNPIGSTLIGSPLLLTLFKIGATGVTIGLLFALRKYRRAQLATWWACLILTVLTLRWVTFSSMRAGL